MKNNLKELSNSELLSLYEISDVLREKTATTIRINEHTCHKDWLNERQKELGEIVKKQVFIEHEMETRIKGL